MESGHISSTHLDTPQLRPADLIELLGEWTTDDEGAEWQSALDAHAAVEEELGVLDEVARLKREAEGGPH